MGDLQFKAILEVIIPRLVQLIMDQMKLSETEATVLLYRSALYSMLEIEKSKLWHLSVPALFELLDEEIRTGAITYPEEA